MTRYRAAFVLTLLFALAGTACTRQTSAREIFKLAVGAGKNADADNRWYIFGEIAKAQAIQGYYDDALQALKLTDKFPDQLLVELVSIRAKNGDVSGALKMAENSTETNIRWRCLETVAEVQAASGDLKGATQTARPLPLRFQQSVLEAIGNHQAESGDLESALKTVNEMQRGWSDGVLFAIAENLVERGQKEEAHRIALRISDPDMARNAEIRETTEESTPTDLCELAWRQARSGEFAIANKTLEGAKCDNRMVAYIRDQEGDAAGAERAMRNLSNPADVSAGMAELAKRSAAKEDFTAALRFADSVHVTGADFEEGYLAPALRDIARSWVKKDRKAALKWAEARPDGYQRAMALLGAAEGMVSKVVVNTETNSAPPHPPQVQQH